MEPDDYGEPEIDRLLRELGLELPEVEGNEANDALASRFFDLDGLEDWD